MSGYNYTDGMWDFWEQMFEKFNPNYKQMFKTIPMVDIEEGIDVYMLLEYPSGYKVENLQLKAREINSDESIKELRRYTLHLPYETADGYPCSFGRYFNQGKISLFAFAFPRIGFGVIFTYKAFEDFWFEFEPLDDIHFGKYINGTLYYNISLAEVVANMRINSDYYVIRHLEPYEGEINE